MPFTFSHPAIILPLAYLPKRWFSLTGLIIGSLMPDFEYFLRMRIESNYSHTLSGLFWFDLPLAILIAFIFHNLVRNPLFDNLPAFLTTRFSVFQQFNWNQYFKQNWIVVIVSILIGAASHLFWDSFTHDHGYFVESISALKGNIEIFGYEFPVLKILQHSSTLFGGIIIGFAIFKLPKHSIETFTYKSKYWFTFTVISLIIIVIRLLTGLEFTQVGNVIVTVTSTGIISLILVPIILKSKFNVSERI